MTAHQTLGENILICFSEGAPAVNRKNVRLIATATTTMRRLPIQLSVYSVAGLLLDTFTMEFNSYHHIMIFIYYDSDDTS